ncbi:MAG: hypothetical protein SGPRY_008285 [Prymnesium sp.]
MAYETYRRVVIRSSRLGWIYHASSALCLVFAFYRCISSHAHMQISDIELIPPTVMSFSAVTHECPSERMRELKAVRGRSGSVECRKWDAIEAIEYVRGHVFITTQTLELTQRRCPRGCGSARELWALESQRTALIAAPELSNLSVKHSFRTRSFPTLSADCRQMGGKLVRFKRDRDAVQHMSPTGRHDASQYEVISEYPPDSGRSTHVHLIYSNLWETSMIWQPFTWLRPASSPSFLMFARRLPREEATRLRTLNQPRWRKGRRVVRTSTGIKLEVMGGGGIGSTELLLSLIGIGGSRLRSALLCVLGDVDAVRKELYHDADHGRSHRD